MTSVSTGPFVDWSFNPSCSSSAVKMDAAGSAPLSTFELAVPSSGAYFGNYTLDESSKMLDYRQVKHGLVTLLDVLKFAAENFWKASQILADIRNNPASASSPARAREMRDTLTVLNENLRALDLPVSVREFEKFNSWMNDRMVELGKITSIENQKSAFFAIEPIVKTKIEQVCSVVDSELESRIFFHVQPASALFYDQAELFGAPVNAKFPSIQYDMVEAGNCYAASRSTACVFHLMRIMEVGVQAFGEKLGVTYPDSKNWQNILDESNKAIRALPQKDRSTIKLCEISANLYSVKLVWRNEVMHPNDTYTLEEAENLIRLVKLFLSNLSEVV